MTREELVQMREYQVAQASTEYWNKNKDNDNVSILTAFEDGVAWADAHPENPWISVKDRLPKCCTIPSTEQYIKNRRYWNNKVAPIYIVICSDQQSDYYYQFANFIKFPEDKKPCWIFVGDNIKRNCVTHWMPIPELKKGE